MGINFQELLCFARVEMSELHLLETEHNISTIAKDVGFSTTSYYEKYFKKWFGCRPEEYRVKNLPKILSSVNQPDYRLLSDNEAVTLIRQQTSAMRDQEKNDTTIQCNNFVVNIASDIKPIKYIEHSLEVLITEEDYISVGLQLLHMVTALNTSNVVLLTNENNGNATSKIIINMLNIMGYHGSIAPMSRLIEHTSAGHDSIAYAIHIIRKYFLSDEKILKCRLRDTGHSKTIFKGLSACLTSTLIPKPSFYAYRMLNDIKGNVIKVGEYYYVVKNEDSSYIIISMNYNYKILDLILRDTNVYEVSKVINSFNDELNIDFSIPVPGGRYSIIRYIMSNEESLFSYMNHLNFPEEFPFADSFLHSLNTAPFSKIDVKDVTDCIHVSSTIRGVGMQVIIIKKL